MSSLRKMDMSGNKLDGPIPESFSNLDLLESLDLSDNSLSGNLPEGIGNLPNLQSLFLGNNDFTGPVPASYSGISDLQVDATIQELSTEPANDTNQSIFSKLEFIIGVSAGSFVLIVAIVVLVVCCQKKQAGIVPVSGSRYESIESLAVKLNQPKLLDLSKKGMTTEDIAEMKFNEAEAHGAHMISIWA